MTDLERIMGQMALADKISLCTGADFWHTKRMPRYGIPSCKMADGPHGLRCQEDGVRGPNLNDSIPATCFPAAVTAGASWNAELYAMEGEAIGKEARAAGVSLVLGPGCNIKRNPLCGRNFEYLSEDPYLSGKMAAAFVNGQQGAGVSSCLKHFAANSQEYKRMNSDSRMDERTLREIYLAAFETAVREAKPGVVMCAYNKLNGVYCSDNRRLLTDILRNEWGFDGMVVTDWGALNDRVEAFRAGCDLNMPGGASYMDKAARDAVKSGALDEADVDASVRRILALAFGANGAGDPCDMDAHDALACAIAEQGAVLLKNEGGILPLKADGVALIGYMAKHVRYQGTGSSHINPTRLTSLTDALPDAPYVPCCDQNGDVSEASLIEAAEAASAAQVAVVVAGLPESYESEGFDRAHMRMPEGHIRMIEAVAAANPNTVVVLLGGSPMETPWLDRVKAVLYMGLAGQAGGRACGNLLTGKANPCGKLTETWPIRYDDVVSRDSFGRRDAEYRESVYVGYRYYDKAQKPVRFPFGFGLSYTAFAYSDLEIDGRTVTASVTNIGEQAGAEVVQLYIAPPKGGVFRPEKELKGFQRVWLEVGESKRVRFELDERSFVFWQDGWRVAQGAYDILLGASSRDVRLKGVLHVQGETVAADDRLRGSWYETLEESPSRTEWETLMGRPVPVAPEPEKGAFTMNHSLLEMRDSSRIMRMLYGVTQSYVAKGFGGKPDPDDPTYRMMLTCAVDCPLRSIVINGSGVMPERLMRGLLEMANGRFLRGLFKLIKG